MAYREVGMLEVKEVLRLWLGGVAKKGIARQLGLDPKTVRRYVEVAEGSGLGPGLGPPGLTEEHLSTVILALRPDAGRPKGDAWTLAGDHREMIRRFLDQRVRLSKIRRLLLRQGVSIPYPTLHRFAVAELDFGRTAATVPVADGEPGHEVQVDTGWMILLQPDERGRRRRMRAWIFTAGRSRHRFVYPCFPETTASAIEACEAAWTYYGGIFRVLLPDNTKAIVQEADPLHPKIIPGFLEYAQARGFHIDPARVRHAKDKARVERSVPSVRDDCFGGENLRDLDHAREHARQWSLHEYGTRRHGRTQRRPLEHFEAEEKAALLPAPTETYDVPLWSDPKIHRDHFAQVDRALYSLPTRLIGKTLRARADRHTVRFYDGAVLVKTHPRKRPGEKSLDRSDLPAHKTPYALRDVDFLKRRAAEHGPAIGRFAARLLDDPLPWTRMRRVYALLGLVKKYGADRVEPVCAVALDADMLNVHRLQRMLEAARTLPPPAPGKVIPIARHLRPKEQYRLLPLPGFGSQETRDDA